MSEARGEHFVQSLERGLAVIRAFGAEDPELTLSDVARRTGLTRAAARRFLLTLTDLGYVRTDGRQFALTPRVLDLGYAYLSSLTPARGRRAAPRAARRRGARVQSSVSVLDGDDIVYVGRVPTSRIMRVAINVGTRFPAYATSMGRVLLAALPDDELDAYLARAEIRPLTARAIATPPSCAPSSTASAPRAGRWSTRSSRRACARSPRRSATPAAARRRRQRLRPRQPRLARGHPARRCCRRCWPTAQRIEADLQPRLQSSVMASTQHVVRARARAALSDAGYRRGGARQAVIELLDEQPCALVGAGHRGPPARARRTARRPRFDLPRARRAGHPRPALARRGRRRRRALRAAAPAPRARAPSPPGVRRLWPPRALPGRRPRTRDPRTGRPRRVRRLRSRRHAARLLRALSQ